MTEKLVVRVARDDDLLALQEIYRRSSLSNAGDRASLENAPDALVWAGDGIATGATLLAEDAGGRIVGFATAVPLEDGLELEDLFVDPDRMRRGAATLLVDELRVRATTQGRTWMEVTANPHAAEFYAAAGFTPVGAVRTRFGPAPRLRVCWPG